MPSVKLPELSLPMERSELEEIMRLTVLSVCVCVHDNSASSNAG